MNFLLFLLSGKVYDLISCAFVNFDKIMFSTAFVKRWLDLINMNSDLPLKAIAKIWINFHCSEKVVPIKFKILLLMVKWKWMAWSEFQNNFGKHRIYIFLHPHYHALAEKY